MSQDVASSLKVNEAFARFVMEWRGRELPDAVRHEGKRSLLNILGAAGGALDHPAIVILRSKCHPVADGTLGVRLLWSAERVQASQAVLTNAAMMHVLDFDDSYRATYCHPAPTVAAALLAEADLALLPGTVFLQALVLGIEVQLALSHMLFPSHYLRGFHITPTTGGVGAAAACSAARPLAEYQTTNALGLAMTTSGGLIESLGTMANAYGVGSAARLGREAADLAEAGLDSTPTMFEGEKGMLRAASDEDSANIPVVVASLGQRWRILETSYKRFPTETITQAPLEAVLRLRERIGPDRRARLQSITLLAKPIVADVVEQRQRKFGLYPETELAAKFDLRYCMAAAWITGRWSAGELLPERVRDPAVRAVRDRIRVVKRDDWLGNQISCEFTFNDGSVETEFIEAFLGSYDNPMSDVDLESKLRHATENFWPPERADKVIEAIWRLEDIDTTARLLDLLALPPSEVAR